MTDDAPTDPQPRRRDVTHIYGTRIRTTTAAMVIAFVGLLVLFGYTTDHYAQIDAENEANNAARRPAVTSIPTEDYTTRTPTTSTHRSSTTSGTTTTPADGESEPSATQSSVPSNPLPLPSWLFPQQQQQTQQPTTQHQTPTSQVPQR